MSYGDTEISGKQIGCVVIAIIVVFVAAFLFGGCGPLQRVDPGNVGLIVDYGRGTSSGQPSITKVPTGSYQWINPITQSLQEYPIAQQTLTMVRAQGEGQVAHDDSVGCQDKNGIPINVDSSALWRVNADEADKLYLLKPGIPLVGDNSQDISSVVVRREVRNAVTNACSQYTYDEMYGAKRIAFGLTVTELLGSELDTTHIILDKFLLGEIYLSDQQQEAISKKAVAQQAAIEASFLAEKAKNEAAAAVAKAEGDKQVAILQAEAQAEAIQIIQQQLDNSPLYIEYIYAKNWDGALPTTILLSNGQQFPLIAPLLSDAGITPTPAPQ